MQLTVDLGNIPHFGPNTLNEDNFSFDYAEEIDLTNTVVLETPIKSDSSPDNNRDLNMAYWEEKGDERLKRIIKRKEKMKKKKKVRNSRSN